MKNSASEQSFYIESEGEEDENYKYGDGDGDGSDSEHSNYSNDDDDNDNANHESKTAWPQSYRQTMDLYGTVPSPSLTFLGPPSLSQLGSSFLSSSLVRRHTPDRLPSFVRPLLPQLEAEKSKQPRGSYYGPPALSRKSSLRKAVLDKRASIAQEPPVSYQSTYGQAVLNGMNVLCGVGILSTPYAIREGGWLGLCILVLFACLSYYTGILLRHCLDSQPDLETYPDIGQAAFGITGRIIISIILYVELYACCVEYIILEGDNLSSLFPNAHLNFGGFELDSHHIFALATTLAVLPTVWLRDLSILSYLSAGGVLASTLVVVCLFWVGTVDGVNVHAPGTAINLSSLPVAIGLYGYCYSGHAVFPNIYSSMQKPSEYPAVLLTSFGLCTLMYAGAAIMGYYMFGDGTKSQFTLNMPNNLVASKLAVWTTVVNPFTKYALTMAPVAMSLEELIPSTNAQSHMYSLIIRTLLVISTLLVGLSIPFFGLVSALIGSFLTMLVTLILPCACYLSILRGKLSLLQRAMCVSVIGIGVVASAIGSYSALSKIIDRLR
ncbi:amino acid transporter AVT1C-like [Salvia splendens]|uniref:amino acid transporter AVT1C-like n=1 Tax=Salvia splendens TaxID=180675 RepID=UPI001C252FBA|nr:amino acid transporter AVT1C-like [Salvia splendens]XP_042037019.1 amino acid transporter AVT1C-like [Salvia splendens]